MTESRDADPDHGPDPGDDQSEDPRRQPVAVALGYEPNKGQTPKVLAGGRGRVAEQILDIAFAHGVKVREDANLAELLSAIDVDSDIPAEAFAAVAEILVYVYRANGRLDELLDEAETETTATPFTAAARDAAGPADTGGPSVTPEPGA